MSSRHGIRSLWNHFTPAVAVMSLCAEEQWQCNKSPEHNSGYKWYTHFCCQSNAALHYISWHIGLPPTHKLSRAVCLNLHSESSKWRPILSSQKARRCTQPVSSENVPRHAEHNWTKVARKIIKFKEEVHEVHMYGTKSTPAKIKL